MTTGVVERYSAWCVAVGKAPSSTYIRTRYLRRLAAHVDLLTATEDDLVVWMGAHSWAPETRRSVRSALLCFYSWAVVHGLRDDNPVVDLPPVRVPPPCPRPASDAAVRAARIRANQSQRLMIDLAALAGLRRAEIAGLRREDLDGDLLRVKGKGGRTRAIPVPVELAARLLTCPPGPIFPGRFGGYVHPDYVGRTLSRLLGPGLTAHSLRHRYATRCYEGTGDLLALQELLGHSSPETTRRYVRVSMAALRATAAAAG